MHGVETPVTSEVPACPFFPKQNIAETENSLGLANLCVVSPLSSMSEGLSTNTGYELNTPPCVVPETPCGLNRPSIFVFPEVAPVSEAMETSPINSTDNSSNALNVAAYNSKQKVTNPFERPSKLAKNVEDAVDKDINVIGRTNMIPSSQIALLGNSRGTSNAVSASASFSSVIPSSQRSIANCSSRRMQIKSAENGFQHRYNTPVGTPFCMHSTNQSYQPIPLNWPGPDAYNHRVITPSNAIFNGQARRPLNGMFFRQPRSPPCCTFDLQTVRPTDAMFNTPASQQANDMFYGQGIRLSDVMYSARASQPSNGMFNGQCIRPSNGIFNGQGIRPSNDMVSGQASRQSYLFHNKCNPLSIQQSSMTNTTSEPANQLAVVKRSTTKTVGVLQRHSCANMNTVSYFT